MHINVNVFDSHLCNSTNRCGAHGSRSYTEPSRKYIPKKGTGHGPIPFNLPDLKMNASLKPDNTFKTAPHLRLAHQIIGVDTHINL